MWGLRFWTFHGHFIFTQAVLSSYGACSRLILSQSPQGSIHSKVRHLMDSFKSNQCSLVSVFSSRLVLLEAHTTVHCSIGVWPKNWIVQTSIEKMQQWSGPYCSKSANCGFKFELDSEKTFEAASSNKQAGKEGCFCIQTYFSLTVYHYSLLLIPFSGSFISFGLQSRI